MGGDSPALLSVAPSPLQQVQSQKHTGGDGGVLRCHILAKRRHDSAAPQQDKGILGVLGARDIFVLPRHLFPLPNASYCPLADAGVARPRLTDASVY